jgi:DNA adenine methylase
MTTGLTKTKRHADRSSTALAPFRSPLRYPGGKQKAIAQIASVLPASATEYREPMIGGGSVFFHARSINFAQSYWINDKFRELVSFWRAVQDDETCERLIADLEILRASFSSSDEIKEYFNAARAESLSSEVSSYREALLFFFFNRVTFSGTTRAGGFSSAAALRRFTASSIERLRPLPTALRDVRITNDDFTSVITAPGDDVFLFLDPPYFTATRLYGRNGSLHSFDHELLATTLRTTPHRFLITYDDCDEIRSLYSWAKIQTWQLQYGMNNCNSDNSSKIGSELFISNY